MITLGARRVPGCGEGCGGDVCRYVCVVGLGRVPYTTEKKTQKSTPTTRVKGVVNKGVLIKASFGCKQRCELNLYDSLKLLSLLSLLSEQVLWSCAPFFASFGVSAMVPCTFRPRPQPQTYHRASFVPCKRNLLCTSCTGPRPSLCTSRTRRGSRTRTRLSRGLNGTQA